MKRRRWEWFPANGSYALLGIEGYPAGAAVSSAALGVTFSVLENGPPWRELRRFRAVPLRHADTVFAHLRRELRREPEYIGRAHLALYPKGRPRGAGFKARA